MKPSKKDSKKSRHLSKKLLRTVTSNYKSEMLDDLPTKTKIKRKEVSTWR